MDAPLFDNNKKRNKSRQREAIINYLYGRKDHPTAEKIYISLREEFPKISLGTVYRNLTLLSDDGTIQKVCCGDASEHFDGNPAPHNHFVCENCGCVLDLEMDNVDFIDTLASNKFQGKITSHSLYFKGICPDCL